MRIQLLSFHFLIWLSAFSWNAGAAVPPHSRIATFLSNGITSLWSPPPSDSIWQFTRGEQERVAAMATSALQDAKKAFQDISHNVDGFSANIQGAVDRSREITAELQSKADLQMLADRLTLEASNVIGALMPENMNKAQMTASAVGQLEGGFVKIREEFRRAREKAREQFKRFKEAINRFLWLAAKTIIIIIIIACSMGFLPILLGFGPRGPLLGSLAACMQGSFWAGAIAKGSWFSLLQGAGMIEGFLPKIGAVFRALVKLLGGAIKMGIRFLFSKG